MALSFRAFACAALVAMPIATVSAQITNIAPFGVPTQTSTRAGSTTQGDVAVVAIDGNTDGVFNNGSVTHTNTQNNPSWQVVFDQPRTLTAANLFNRTDCCGNRLDNFRLEVFNGAAQTFVFNAGGGIGASTNVPLGGAVGDQVRITLPFNNRVLSLAEVEVFSDLQPGDSYLLSGRNIARGGTASQTSTRTGDPKGNQAILAIDGNTSGAFGNRSVTHTAGSEPDPAWTVDLGSVQNIDSIRLSERTDCCDTRLSDFTVSVLDDTMTSVFSTNVSSVDTQKHIAVDFGTEGQFVQVQLNDNGGNRTLELAEVEVFGGELQNLARNPLASATQSSDRVGNGGNVASVAIDGNTDGRFFSEDSVTHTAGNEPDPFWLLDLGLNAEVENIRLFNRTDCCGDRLDDFRLSLLDAAMNEVDGVDVNSPLGASETFFFDGQVGRFVQIQFEDVGTDRVLSLAEVQVFGVVAVPEPASIALWSLLGIGICVGGLIRHRTKHC